MKIDATGEVSHHKHNCLINSFVLFFLIKYKKNGSHVTKSQFDINPLVHFLPCNMKILMPFKTILYCTLDYLGWTSK